MLPKEPQVVRDGLKGQGGPLQRLGPLETRHVAKEEAAEAQKLKDAVLVHVRLRAIFEALHRGHQAVHIPATVQRRGRRLALPLGHHGVPVSEIHQAPALASNSTAARELRKERLGLEICKRRMIYEGFMPKDLKLYVRSTAFSSCVALMLGRDIHGRVMYMWEGRAYVMRDTVV